MLKITEKIHYHYDGKWQPLQELRKPAGDIANAKTGIIGSITVQIREAKDIQELTDCENCFCSGQRSKSWLALILTWNYLKKRLSVFTASAGTSKFSSKYASPI